MRRDRSQPMTQDELKALVGQAALAAEAWGRPLGPAAAASLRWYAEPGSPDGRSERPPARIDGLLALDLAYAPLRLDGETGWPRVVRDQVFQLITPNKALGLTGVRFDGAEALALVPHYRRLVFDIGYSEMRMTEHDPDRVQQWRDTKADEFTSVHPVVRIEANKILDLAPETWTGIVATARTSRSAVSALSSCASSGCAASKAGAPCSASSPTAWAMPNIFSSRSATTRALVLVSRMAHLPLLAQRVVAVHVGLRLGD